MRSLTTDQNTAVHAAQVTMVWFIELGFSTVQRLCTAGHTLPWNGHNWIGFGQIVSIEPITETDTMAATGYKISITLTSSALIALALSENVQGDACTIWLGLYDQAGTMIGTPIKLDEGVCDQVEINDSRDSCVFSLSIESEIADFDRPNTFRYSNADQQTRYPGDKFFEYAEQATERAVAFPSAAVIRAGL